ncbi:MAG: NUDIX domain-containing protein [Pseudomonadota bacterium]
MTDGVPPDDLSRLRYAAGVDHQVGVLAYTDDRQIVIVTSRRTGRWVFPKGSIDAGMTPEQAAEQEALEEAGLIGRIDQPPIGCYVTPKIRPPLIWTVEVTLYPMRIDEILDDYPELSQRTRRFVTLTEAEGLLSEAAMTDLARRFWASGA